MSLERLDHTSIRTTDLKKTCDFYVNALGMVDGDRPNFDFPGNWLYVGDRPVVHLIGIDPNDASGLSEYLGDKAQGELVGGGAVDHIAFRADDVSGMHDRLTEFDIPWRDREVPDLNLHQIFVEDPNGITIELNFDGNKSPA